METVYLDIENEFYIRWSESDECWKLINLDTDPAEAKNLSGDYPEVVRRLTDLARKARSEFGDLGRPGSGRRPAGYVGRPTPQVMPGSG